ncbi:hypothetical protein P5Y74_03035 [Stenotrophomonas maltophilia]|nr:hypothetical protein [Stenotrophomonas maltophilia]
MKASRGRERLWALRLMARHACHRASLRVGAALLPMLPAPARVSLAVGTASALGPLLQAERHGRAFDTLQRLGHAPSAAAELSARFLAGRWLRQAHFQRLQSLPFSALQHVLRGMAWQDPGALWAAAAGRRRVVCLLPTGDVELALAAVLDRPGAPAHYFVNTHHRDDSPELRTLLALKRQGHRLEIGRAQQRGEAWRQLRRGATVVALLDPCPWRETGVTREPAPLRLARLANVPVLVLGHRRDGSEAGTLSVLGEFSAESLAEGATALYAAAHAFLAAAPHDWHDLDR